MEDSIPSDIPQKQCQECENYFDATPEHFYVKNKQTGILDNLCKPCRIAHNAENYRQKHPKKEDPIKPTREELDDLYNKQNLTTKQIGEKFGYAHQTIAKWLRKEGLNHQFEKLTLEELNEMYTIEKMTCRQIAAETGFAASSIKNWLREYGIERRPPTNGLAYHGVEPPSHEELYHLRHVERKSYREIGEIYGIDQSAVPHWIKKYDIPKPDFKPPREELSALYESGLSLTAIGDMFGYSWSTMRTLCQEYDIEVRPDGWEYKRYLCQDGDLVRSLYEQRVDEWLFAHNVPHTYEPNLPWHKHFKSDFLANGWYIEVWGVENNEIYKQRCERKRQLYQQHNAPLIELPYYFFSEQKRANLERRLSQCLSRPIV